MLATLVACSAPPASVGPGPTGQVRVVDGDTLDVAGVRVRLHGIDAPENGQLCHKATGEVWDCGQWAVSRARHIAHGQVAVCVARDTDTYGRVVATCTVRDGTDIGKALVQEGAALAYRRYSRVYVADERAAKSAGRGIWSGDMLAPEAARRQAGSARTAAAAPDCRIKGNISESGRIYHVPGQEYYAQTQINAQAGERWFCDEAQARAAGWRRARR